VLGNGADLPEQSGEERVAALLRRFDRLFDGAAGDEVLDEAVLLGLGAVQASDRLGGPFNLVRFRLASQQFLAYQAIVEGPRLAAAWIGAPRQVAGEDQRPELGLVFLAVAVDAAVALLDADQGPRKVVVDQQMALLVQVDAFGRDVAGEQDAHWVVAQAEPLDDVALLLVCGGIAVHHLGYATKRQPGLTWVGAGAAGEAQGGRHVLGQPLQGRDALGEHHHPGVRAWPNPQGL